MNYKNFYGRQDGKNKSNLFFNKHNEKPISRISNIYQLNRKSEFHLSDDENDVYSEENTKKGPKLYNKNDNILDNRTINKNSNIKKTDNKVNMINNKIYKTAEEKFKLLEDLDRLSSPQNNNLGLDRPIVSGTCLDMCPEKERYLRECQDSISIFERDEKNQFDHKRAVKEYERCSIDQKESQPHDLRPTEVLQRTMNYLLSQIVDVDNEKVSWRQWYRFLWDKTRSIRKDITQQNLCNETVIDIVESITRFHIFCGAWLCEDTSDNFDPRMNDDHLKNCLQTLKNMYSDMPPDSCANEPEFRSYMIILNLDKGEMLDEAQKLTSRVFYSPKLTFAISVYQAVSTNNYVRFFRLLEQADLILSCLLHRFIVPMRLRSLEVMNKAYVTTKSTDKGANQIPLSTIVRQLKFESINEVLDFCNTINQKWIHFMDVPMIILNHSNLVVTKKQELIKKSIMLVESKRENRKLSIIFNGDQPIPDFTVNLPECKMVSFDENSCYIGSKQIPSKIQSKLLVQDINDEVICLDSSEEEEKQSKNQVDALSGLTNRNEPEFEIENRKKKAQPIFNNIFKFENSSKLTNLDKFPISNTPTNSICNTSNLFTKISSINSKEMGLFSNPQSQSATKNHELFNDIKFHSVCENQYLFNKKVLQNSIEENIRLSEPIQEFTFQNSNHQTNYTPISSYIDKASKNLIISKEKLCQIFNENIENIIFEVIEDQCYLETGSIMDFEKNINLEISQVEEDLIHYLFQEVVMEVSVEHSRSKLIVSELIKEETIDEMVGQLINEIAIDYLNEKQYLADLLRLHQMKIYFRNWVRFTRKSLKDRKCLTKLSSAPRVLDDFSACQQFRGKVRKISTDWFTSKDVSWSKIPVFCRLDKMVGVEQSIYIKVGEQYANVQTSISYYNKMFVPLKAFVRDFIQNRFFNVLDTQLNVLKFASLVDPNPELIIIDYNNLIDELTNFIYKSGLIISVDMIKLKLTQINLKSIEENDWEMFLDDVFENLGLSPYQRNYYFKIADDIFSMLNQKSPRLSYFHLRLFPWIHIIKKAILNKLKEFDLIDISNNEISIEMDDLNAIPKLQIERNNENMTVMQCINKCKKYEEKFQSPKPAILKSRRSEIFNKILNKVTDIEKIINECAENFD